jgi:hypothetical protein
MKKLLVFALVISLFASCTKKPIEFDAIINCAFEQNVKFTNTPQYPYTVEVKSELETVGSLFVFRASNEAIYNTFKDAVKDSSLVKIHSEWETIVSVKKLLRLK